MERASRNTPRKRNHAAVAAIRRGLSIPLGILILWAAGCRDPQATGAGDGSGLPTAEDSALSGFDRVENGVHVRTGFVAADGLMPVVQNCTPCHSAKLVTQNRMSREGWEATIRWMQKTQNLWDLGANETVILDYLATYYAPENKGRRDNLKDIEWYELEP